MKALKFMKELDQLKLKVGLYKFGFICLIGMQLFSYIQSSLYLSKQKIILIPPSGAEKMILIGNNANEVYLRHMSRYVIGLALTYTPHSIKGQYDELLNLYHASNYGEMRPALEKLAENVILTNTTQTFHPSGVMKYDLKQKMIRVEGSLQQTVNNLKQRDVRQVYIIKYQVLDGQFFLMEMYPEEKRSSN